MLSQFQKFSKLCSLRSPVATFVANARFLSQAAQKPITPSFVEKPVAQSIANNAPSEAKVILLTKKHLKQSPLKMKFLVRLVRGSWIPDAVAQMKFSPKHRAEDIAKILNVIYLSPK